MNNETKTRNDMSRKKTSGEEEFNAVPKRHAGIKILIIFLIIIVIGLVVFFVIRNVIAKNEPGSTTTVTESTLEKIIRESKLYTAEYPYNSYVAVADDDGNAKYYAAYNGTVKAGFDVNDVKVDLDKDHGKITIRLPEIKIMDVNVDEGSLDYIFESSKYETETIASEAYQKAYDDLKTKADADADIIIAATDNAKMVEKELVEPWVNQVDQETHYDVQVLSHDEEQSVSSNS